jgi:hypothetical protein
MMYHGGDRGLRVGDYILPPEKTGRSNTSGVAPEDVYRRDRVYITEHLQDAKLFAAKNNEDPVVYVVEPVGELEPDDDNKTPGRSLACTSAKIVAVREISAKEIQQARNAVIQAIERAKAANR